ncbi:MAG: hypothetical protein AVDCRST_MAG53-3470, partial [uncultured Solirubrobacteraceae bacterium]
DRDGLLAARRARRAAVALVLSRTRARSRHARDLRTDQRCDGLAL